jgi:hypothetical protein
VNSGTLFLPKETREHNAKESKRILSAQGALSAVDGQASDNHAGAVTSYPGGGSAGAVNGNGM